MCARLWRHHSLAHELTCNREMITCAERKAGELLTALAEQTEKGGDRRSENFQCYQADNIENITPYRAALADTATPIATAQRWQTVAQVPDEVFEEHVRNDDQTKGNLCRAIVVA